MSAPRKTPEERQAIVKALQARQRAADRRKAWLIYGIGGLVVAAIIASVAFVVVGEVRKREETTAAATRPIEGEQDFPASHGTTPVNP